MGTIVTLVVAFGLLLVLSRALWPRKARAPLPLYVGTIVFAFFAGMVAGSLVDGRELARTLQFAGLVSLAIAGVAAVSWLRVKAPDQEEAAERQRREQRAARRRGERT